MHSGSLIPSLYLHELLRILTHRQAIYQHETFKNKAGKLNPETAKISHYIRA